MKDMKYLTFWLLTNALVSHVQPQNNPKKSSQASQKASIPNKKPQANKVGPEGFGGFSISKELFDYILEILHPGKTILELGSGWGSGQLSKHFTVFSIEHDKKWLNKYETNYIYAPIKDGWYDVALVAKHLPEHYDLILVDGPPKSIGREGFYKNLALFNTNVPIIFDDVHRTPDFNLSMKVSEKLEKPIKIFGEDVDQSPLPTDKKKPKRFGVILP